MIDLFWKLYTNQPTNQPEHVPYPPTGRRGKGIASTDMIATDTERIYPIGPRHIIHTARLPGFRKKKQKQMEMERRACMVEAD